MTTAKKKVSDAQFIAYYHQVGPTHLSNILGVDVRVVHKRRSRLEAQLGISINTLARQGGGVRKELANAEGKIESYIENGVILVGSDAHYWPGPSSTAHRAFVKFIKDLSPEIVVMNGDVFDGASVSRHAPIGWESKPTVLQELDAVRERLQEVADAAGSARKIWTMGNHDLRYSSRLANVATEFSGVDGFKLEDHFPEWERCWMLLVNDAVVIKHRHRSGVHAGWNNTLMAGKTMVTGHTHNLGVTPFSDYSGTRYGVQTGSLADAYGEQFSGYTELNPVNWRSGCAVLTFDSGRLLWPELVHVLGPGEIEFRGSVYTV